MERICSARMADIRADPILTVALPQTFSGEGHYQEVDAAIASLVKEFSENGRLDRKQTHFVLERQKQGARTPLAFPGKICADETGQRLFISDTGHNRIVVVNTAGKVLDIIGNGQSGCNRWCL